MVCAIEAELAGLYIEMGELDKAEQIGKGVLSALDKIKRSDYRIAKCLRNSALIQYMRGNIMEAEQLYIEAIKASGETLYSENAIKSDVIREYSDLFLPFSTSI